MMGHRVLFATLCIIKVVNTQMNGEFWWLHNKVKSFHGGEITPAKFEELNEFDNDQYDTIVFENDNENEGFVLKENVSNRREDKEFRGLGATDSGNFSWPDDTQFNLNNNNILQENQTDKPYQDNKDEFVFHFPDANNTWKKRSNTTNSSAFSPPKLKPEIVLDKLVFKPNHEDTVHAEHICSYITEEECNGQKGSIYNHRKRLRKSRKKRQSATICCVLPLDNDDPWAKIYFPNSEELTKHRVARSTSGELDKALNQRKALLFKQFDSMQNVRTTTPKQITKRIVTPDEDDEDPYENIRNPMFRPKPKPNKRPSSSASENNYGGQQDYDYYDNVYSEEVPKPGLTGLYSDNGQNHGQATWTVFNAEDSEEDLSAGYGPSTADPRIDYRKPIAQGKPIKCKNSAKVSSISEESTYETGSQSISYHANPDFQVLQGFKLLNLVQNRNRSYSKHSRKTIAQSKSDDDEESEDMEADDDYSDFIDQDKQVYSKCGKSAKVQPYDDRNSGEAHHKSHPWLCLVSRSRRQQSTLCHATLVHPRAAITSANCVYGASSGEVVVYAGVWDLNDDHKKNQQRMASVHVHPRYSPENLGNNLAILHWKRALRVGAAVRPACLADPRVGDSCALVGWGGHGQAIQNRPRWQHASILTPRECNSCSTKHHADKYPTESFCAAADTKGCVTAEGGSLVCSSNGRHASVGVVVWRESCDVTSPLVLLPAHEWTVRALATLGII